MKLTRDFVTSVSNAVSTTPLRSSIERTISPSVREIDRTSLNIPMSGISITTYRGLEKPSDTAKKERQGLEVDHTLKGDVSR